MLKLIFPDDVGPMPQFTDWLSMADEQLNLELILRGHKPRKHFPDAVHKLVLLELVELYNWLSDLTESHGTAQSDLVLLLPVIRRRMAMGREQLEGAWARYKEMNERTNREIAELEATHQAQLQRIDELKRYLAYMSYINVAE